MSTNRRRVIRSIGAGVGATALAGVATGASNTDPASTISRSERRRRMEMIPVEGTAVRKRWFGSQPAYDESGMYAYVGSINRDDLCHWRASGCLYAAAAASAAGYKLGKVPGAKAGAVAGFVSCTLGSAACRVLDDVEKAGLVADSEWLHVYGLAGPWWFRTFDTSFPDWYVVVTVEE